MMIFDVRTYTTPVEVLRAARDRIGDESRWCTGAYARDVTGAAEHYSDTDARRWCAIGAFMVADKAASVTAGGSARAFLEAAASELYPGLGIADVNDLLGHQAVMALYRRAIELAEAVAVPA